MRKISVAKTGWVLAIAAVAVFVGVAPAANNVDGQFGVFGNSRLVVGGVPPDNMAADLTSDCTPLTPAPAPFSCDFSTLTFSGVNFNPNNNHLPTLADITTLSTDYNLGGSDCGGGSPRFAISLASGNTIQVYIGPEPQTTGCFYGWQNTGNVVNATDKRWDTSQISGGTFYDTHADALTLAGSTPIVQISVVLDGGWTTERGQDATIDNFTVNNKVMHANDAFHH